MTMRAFCGSGLAPRALVLLAVLVLIGISGCGGPSRSKRSSSNKPGPPKPSVKRALADGQDFLDNRNPTKAIAAFSRAIKLDPKCKQAYVWRGVAHQESNDRASALADFTKAIELDPTDDYAYEQRAAIYEEIQEPAKAKADKDKAFELRQKNRDDMRKRLKGKKGIK
jgi:Tfp pilus assembly protein PilF